MSAVILIPPQGDVNLAPSELDLQALFLANDPAYWPEGSGDAGLHRRNEGCCMIFCRIPERGFFVLFQARGEKPLALIGDGLSGKSVSVMVNEDTFHISQSYLTDADSAFKAAVNFLRNGTLNPEQHWEVFESVSEGDE